MTASGIDPYVVFQNPSSGGKAAAAMQDLNEQWNGTKQCTAMHSNAQHFGDSNVGNNEHGTGFNAGIVCYSN